jgi:carboxyl-terminal processing protease
MVRRFVIHGVLASLWCASLACSQLRPEPPTATPVPTAAASERQLGVFEVAWTAVRDQYVRADYGGVDWDAVGERYRAEIEAGLTEDEFAETMRAMLATLPGNQALYQTRAERLQQETTDQTVYHGIGAFISFRETPEPHVIILAVIQDSPAEAAGLAAHDSIYAVDGVPFVAEDANAPAERIRGAPESSVTLTVQTPGEERREVTLPREEIRATDVLRGGLLTALDVAYYRVPVVSTANLATTIANDLVTISETTQLRGIILDLRVSRSGTGEWPLGEMLTMFGDGELGEFYTRTTTDTVTVEGQDLGGSQTLPLVILVGRDTEGTPEIFAAALQSAGRAVLLGQSTPGAVEGFDEVALPDGSRMFLATSSFRTTSNLDLAQTGITPDREIDADWDAIQLDTDPVLGAALSLLVSTSPD